MEEWIPSHETLVNNRYEHLNNQQKNYVHNKIGEAMWNLAIGSITFEAGSASGFDREQLKILDKALSYKGYDVVAVYDDKPGPYALVVGI